jgi:hypothetical protein
MNITDLDICSICKYCSCGKVRHFSEFSDEATCSKGFPFTEINAQQNGISDCEEFEREYRTAK